MMTMLITLRPITIESDSYHHWPAAPSTPFMNIKVFDMMFNMMTVMIMTTEMMRMITIESDSYHHWPAACTPHPEPFPLMSIHSNQRVGMITLTVAMVLMMLVTVVINTIIINSRLSLSDLVFTADIKVRIFCSTFLICIYSPYCFF